MINELVLYLSNVMGKTLYTDELVYKLENNSLEGIYSDQITFANMKSSNCGVCFDLFVVSKELVYELNDKNQHVALRKDFSGVGLFRYELAKRKSTGQITGTMRFISGTGNEVPAEAIVSGVYDLKLQGNELSWLEQQILYRDQPSKDNLQRSVAFDAKCRFFYENEKLRYEYNGTCYDVISDSLDKELSQDIFPHFVSKEK